MGARLEFLVERDQIQRAVSFEEESVLVGRGADCGLRLDDPQASREHCRFESLGGELFVVDLESANGTWVDGIKVDRRPLNPGETVRVGSTLLHVGGEIAPSLAGAENTRMAEGGREQEMLETFLAVARGLAREEKPEGVAGLLIDAAVALTRAERGFVFLVEEGRTTFSLGRNFAREPVPTPEKKVSQTLLEKALGSKKPLLLEDAASDGEFAGVASISDLGLRSILAVPLHFQGTVLGLLLVDHRLSGGAFRPSDIDLLDGLAGLAGNWLGAASQAQALANTRRKVATLRRQLGRRNRADEEESRRLRELTPDRYPGILGISSAMDSFFSKMDKVVESEVPILIRGESGTGKELVARALHYSGIRAGGPFVVENCGALPETLLESELFGHEKGAFTGASHARTGRFEEAHGGTLLLDEVGEMPFSMQARLLRVLEEGEIRPLGSDKVRQVDVRILAATHTDLEAAVEDGSFREDLYYRLKVVQLEIPPLRERWEDIPLLVTHFLAVEGEAQGRPCRPVSKECFEVLEKFGWPGNVRQLRNEMRRLSLLGEGEVQAQELSSEVGDEETPPNGNQESDSRPLPEKVADLEEKAILDALREAEGNRTEAAQTLGISRFALLRKMEKLGLKTEDGEEP